MRRIRVIGPLEQADDLAGVITGLKLSRPIVLVIRWAR